MKNRFSILSILPLIALAADTGGAAASPAPPAPPLTGEQELEQRRQERRGGVTEPPLLENQHAFPTGTVVAKFKVASKAPTEEDGSVQLVRLLAVVGDDNPDSENSKFFKWTPSGEIRIGMVIKAAAENFKLNGEYLVYFVPVGAPVAAEAQAESEQQPDEEPQSDTVESLVEGNTKEALLELAAKEETEVDSHATKAEIAEAILAARKEK